MFSGLREVDRKVEAKISAGYSENLRKCSFPWISATSAFVGLASGAKGIVSLTATGAKRRS